jgi:hypothetical protein
MRWEEATSMALNRRKDLRSDAAIFAACRIRGIAHHARLTNLSMNGCCADIGHHPAVPGERVLVRLTPLLVLPATVKWVTGRQAGLEFINPIHGAILEQFAARSSRERGTVH